jgi:iron complex transport system substrate-binding protein
VVPVGIQDWYGGHPYGVWPWAQPALGDAKPQVYEGDINFETIASLNPDLIVGVREGITEEEYRLLSQIAPTVVQPKAHAGKVTPWQEILTVIAASVGESRKAADIKQQFEERIDRIRDAHPDWQGKTAVFVNPESGKPHAYASFDNRSKLLTDLGFVIPPAIDVIAEGTNFAYLSLEDLSPIDADVLVWYAYEDNVTPIRELELRRLMRAVREGREVVADDLLSGAWSFLSPLSIPYVLDNIEREIEAAVDGNPATGVPSAVKYGLVS